MCDRDQSARLMSAIDAVNAKFGRRHPARLADQVRYVLAALYNVRGRAAARSLLIAGMAGRTAARRNRIMIEKDRDGA